MQQQARWLETVPVLSPRTTIWGAAGGGGNGCAATPAAAAAVLNGLPRDGASVDGGFSVVPIRTWGDGGSGVQAAVATAALLDAGVEVVNPFVFFARLAQAREQ